MNEILIPYIKPFEPNISHLFQPNSQSNPQQALKNSGWSKEEGWELLAYDFGLVSSSQQTQNPGVANPFIIFYNRYTTILRVFILKTQEFNGQNSGTKDAVMRLEYLETKILQERCHL